MEINRVTLRWLVTVTFCRDHVHQDRFRGITARAVERGLQLLEIMPVNRTDVAETETLPEPGRAGDVFQPAFDLQTHAPYRFTERQPV